jgi:hypothetical protein
MTFVTGRSERAAQISASQVTWAWNPLAAMGFVSRAIGRKMTKVAEEFASTSVVCHQANATAMTARVVGVLGMRSSRVASGCSGGKNLNSPDVVWRLEPSQVPR